MTKDSNDDYYKQLYDLQVLDFVLVELSLYLDTHPTDLQAVQQFNQYTQRRQQAAAQYEMNFGPLLQYGHSYSRFPWQWAAEPWPWQV
jgi:spore coat protein JB